MKYVLSTVMWVESIAKKEIERQWGKILEVNDRIITFEGGKELIPRINFWSRVGNKMYMLLAEKDNCTDFDDLFDTVNSINWKQYFKKDFPILVKATSQRSELGAIPTIQGLGKKAIVKSLSWWRDVQIKEDPDLEKMDILLLLVDNKLRVLLNTSGKALHMRWYRTEAWEAPIKESLAAACILLSNWRFKETFYDPFCGSWTFAIEALMIARNIAPWLRRKFAFEWLNLVDYETSEYERWAARKKRFEWEYDIRATDIDPQMVKIAMANADRAGQEWRIDFRVADFVETVQNSKEWDFRWTIITNPPYDIRLKEENIDSIYRNIDKLFRLNPELKWWAITAYTEFDNLIKLSDYKKRKLYNGWELCYLYRRK